MYLRNFLQNEKLFDLLLRNKWKNFYILSDFTHGKYTYTKKPEK